MVTGIGEITRQNLWNDHHLHNYVKIMLRCEKIFQGHEYSNGSLYSHNLPRGILCRGRRMLAQKAVLKMFKWIVERLAKHKHAIRTDKAL